MSDLDPVEAIVRYEHVAPVDMLDNDNNRGPIECPSQRVIGNRRDSVDGAGWEMLFGAI